jgi:hypothetical protein
MKNPLDLVQDIFEENESIALGEVFRLLIKTCHRSEYVMDGISEYVFLRRESGVELSKSEWDEIKTWMVENWSQDPEFVSNAVWLIYHGHMSKIAFLVKSASQSTNDDVRRDASMVIEQWNSVYEDFIH